MKQTPLEAALEKEIYVDRLLVLLEQADGFRQVILTPAQFKKVSDACIVEGGLIDKGGMQQVSVELGEDVIDKKPFEGMRDFE